MTRRVKPRPGNGLSCGRPGTQRTAHFRCGAGRRRASAPGPRLGSSEAGSKGGPSHSPSPSLPPKARPVGGWAQPQLLARVMSLSPRLVGGGGDKRGPVLGGLEGSLCPSVRAVSRVSGRVSPTAGGCTATCQVAASRHDPFTTEPTC